LALLVALEEKRARHLEAARSAIASGDGRQAAAHAEAANQLRHGDDADRLLALGRLVGRDFSAAWTIYENMQIHQKVDLQTIDLA
jgi:hypothetical protein